MTKTDLVMLHGVLQRSGTNLLNQILLLYPRAVQPVLKIRENWFLHHSDLLYAYSDRLFQLWSNSRWGGEEFSREEFYSTIGGALAKYIGKGTPDASDRVLLTKTPSVRHLQRSFEMFPSSKVVVITRDPRDIAASAFKTWNRPVAQTIDDWNGAATDIFAFERQAPRERYLLLRYEDLIDDRKRWVTECIRFLGFEETVFPWDALSDLPVFGSSEEGGTWQVKASSPSFRPVGRWRSLPDADTRYFSQILPSSLDYFGYSESGDHQPLPHREERLEKGIQTTEVPSAPGPARANLLIRATKLRQALGLIAEAALGERVANYARRKLSRNRKPE